MRENPEHVKMEHTMDRIRRGAKKRKYSDEIKIERLEPFRDHLFQLYEGRRLADMVESVRANGIHTPIIVRPISDDKDDKLEILSGHNRVVAAKKAGLKTVPAVVRIGLSDEEALLIVTETNLIQRSFADLKHSERAFALSVHYDAMKKNPGYRSDLVEEIEKLTCAPSGHRTRTVEKLGDKYDLGKETVSRYLRINKLTPALKERLDNDNIGMRVAEALSFLRDNEQDVVENLLADGKKINTQQADHLKEESDHGELNERFIKRVFEPGYFSSKVKPVKLSGKFLSQHFKPGQSKEEIESVIAEALEQYYSNRK